MSAINDYVACKKPNAANLEIIADLIKSAKCAKDKVWIKIWRGSSYKKKSLCKWDGKYSL